MKFYIYTTTLTTTTIIVTSNSEDKFLYVEIYMGLYMNSTSFPGCQLIHT